MARTGDKAKVRRGRQAITDSVRWRVYATIPQKHWRMMSGRQAKVLIEQARRYGIPFGSATVDLPEVVRALHDFLARNAAKFYADESDIRLRVARARREELRVRREEGGLVDAAEARKGRLRIVRWIAGVFDRAGAELAGRVAGLPPAEVKAVVQRYFDELRAEVARGEGETGGGD